MKKWSPFKLSYNLSEYTKEEVLVLIYLLQLSKGEHGWTLRLRQVTVSIKTE